ncbi:MAG: dockerin type I domain-containing protein, partial [Planctomycetota bacterium]
TLSWPTYSPPLAYSIDVAATVQTLLDGGAQYVGLRVDPTSMDNWPSILDDAGALLSIEATGGGYGLGDMNCDGAVNSYDIDGFICALSPTCDYEGIYPDCDRMLADCNEDGDVNSYDIDGFIALVGGG